MKSPCSCTTWDGGRCPATARPPSCLSGTNFPASRGDRDDLIDAATEFATFNCGIAADAQHVFLDLDVVQHQLAQEVADLADQTLGPSPLIRVGREPKQARIYRNGSPGRIRSSKPHPSEIMAGSGMIVAFGIHPDTQQPYRWVSGASPLSLSADSTSIPTIDHLQLQRFLGAVGKALAQAHYAWMGGRRPGRL